VLDCKDEWPALTAIEAHLADQLKGARFNGLWTQNPEPFRAGLDAEQVQEIGRPFLSIHPDFLETGTHFGHEGLGRLRVDDATLVAQQIEQRDIWNGAPIRETASLQIGHGSVAQALAELKEEARFPGPGFPNH